jgi:hypothetical protein
MSVGAGSVMVGAAVYGKELYDYWKPRRIGVYGPTQVGKTTLDRYMTTPGEMEEIPEDERTRHFKSLFGTNYVLPHPSRKRIRYDGKRRVVHSSDMGGEKKFWSLWVDDMVDRQVEGVIFMFDDRAKNGGSQSVDAVAGFEYLVDAIINRRYRYRRLRTRWKGKKYSPQFIYLVANKADRWWDEQASTLWQQQRLREHSMFNAFRPAMIKLQKAGVVCRVNMMATRIGWNVENALIQMLTS